MDRMRQEQQPDIITLFRAIVRSDKEHFALPAAQQEEQFADIMQAITGGAS